MRYPVDVHLQLSELDESPVFVAVVLDMTERVEIEGGMRQAAKLAAMGELAGVPNPVFLDVVDT